MNAEDFPAPNPFLQLDSNLSAAILAALFIYTSDLSLRLRVSHKSQTPFILAFQAYFSFLTFQTITAPFLFSHLDGNDSAARRRSVLDIAVL